MGSTDCSARVYTDLSSAGACVDLYLGSKAGTSSVFFLMTKPTKVLLSDTESPAGVTYKNYGPLNTSRQDLITKQKVTCPDQADPILSE